MLTEPQGKGRAKAFVPDIAEILTRVGRYETKLSKLPKSYQNQPHNLASKLAARYGISAKTIINIDNDTFVLKRN